MVGLCVCMCVSVLSSSLLIESSKFKFSANVDSYDLLFDVRLASSSPARAARTQTRFHVLSFFVASLFSLQSELDAWAIILLQRTFLVSLFQWDFAARSRVEFPLSLVRIRSQLPLSNWFSGCLGTAIDAAESAKSQNSFVLMLRDTTRRQSKVSNACTAFKVKKNEREKKMRVTTKWSQQHKHSHHRLNARRYVRR